MPHSSARAGGAPGRPERGLDAIVLAGGPPAPNLTGSALPKAFAPLGSSTIVERVLAALSASARIGRIVLVGPTPLPAAVAAAVAVPVGERGGLLDNLFAGLAAVGGGAGPVLVAAADVPLLTASAVAAFIDDALAAGVDVAYAIVPRADVEHAAPGVRKTFVRLADGAFTGGSLVLLRPDAFARARPMLERAVRVRKRPWELARLFGAATLLGLATGRLRIAALERRAETVAGLRARAIVCRDAGVALDVDTPAMLEAVRRRLAPAASPVAAEGPAGRRVG